MPFEQARKKLMSQIVSWGAPPPNHSHIPSATEPSILGTVSPLPTRDQPLTNATTTTSMEYVVAEQSRSRIFVSSKDWTVDALVKRGPRFREVPRVSALQPLPKLVAAIETHERSGVPLIIEGWHTHSKWPTNKFTVDWFREHGQQDAKARNVHDWTDRDISIKDLIDKQRAISTSIVPGETERLYGKDAHCPKRWTKWLNESKVIPSRLCPESSNNLMQCLPEADRVETLMCYLGVGDTFTPCHKDLCASSGQNLMCYTENGGSSFWFMTESSSAPTAADYFHELGQELDLETHVVTVEELEKAPFVVYIAEQKLGDLVLVPPRSCHQVVNHGGITIKTSWSRMTLEGLTTAFYHELPIYRRVCRAETYRVKYTIYHALLRCTQELQKYAPPTPSSSNHDSRLPVSSSRDEPLPLASTLKKKHRLAKALRCLIDLFDDVLAEEYCKDHKEMRHMTASSESSAASSVSSDGSTPPTQDSIPRVTCDFCETDVFQSFFECHKCVPSPPLDAMDTETTAEACDGGLVICSSCYAEGRTCKCEVMRPMQCRPFGELLRDRNMAMKVLEQSEMEKSQNRNHMILQEVNILSGRLGIFEAAYAMYQYYQRQQQVRPHELTRICTRARETHQVPRSSQLRCQMCHCSVCFDHILEFGVHSAEAILVHQSDTSHVLWHERHKDRSQFTQAEPQVIRAEKDGVRCDVNHKMVITAKKFNTCMPSNSAFTKPGWYDRSIQSSNIPTEDSDKHAIEEGIDDAADPVLVDSPLPSLTPSPDLANSSLPEGDSDSEERAPLSLGNEMHLSVRPTTMAVIPPGFSYTLRSSAGDCQDGSIANTPSVNPTSVQKKRKRQVLDYILMPPLPKAIQLTIANTKKTRKHSTSQTKGRAKQKEQDGNPPMDVEMPSSSHHTVLERVRTDAPPSSDRPARSLPKRTASKASSKRVVVSSRESTPEAVPAPVKSSILNEDGPPKKKARFSQASPSQPVGEIAAPSTPRSRKRKIDTIMTTTAPSSDRSGAASAPSTSTVSASTADAVVRRVEHIHSRGPRTKPPASMQETREEEPPRIVEKPSRSSGAAGPSNPPPALPSTNVSQATILQTRLIRNLERKLEACERHFDSFEEQHHAWEKQANLLGKQYKAQERRIHKLEDKVNDLMDQQRNSSRQEDYNAGQRQKIQRDISSVREDTEQQLSRIQKQISDLRTDVREVQDRERAQTTISSPTSTHIVLAESFRVYKPDNNGGHQYGFKQRGHPYNRNNNPPNRQFRPPSDNSQGRHHPPGPNRFSREDGGRGNNNGRYKSMLPPQDYPHGNSIKYSFETSDRPPSDQLQLFQPNPNWRPPNSRPPHSTAQPPNGSPKGRKREWGQPSGSRPVSGPNSIDVPPAAASRENGEDAEQTCDVDRVRTPERSVSPARTTTNQEQASSPSSTPFWEDDYEQRDEQPAPAPRLWTPIPPADEQLASASTSSEGSVVVGNPVEEKNPWAS